MLDKDIIKGFVGSLLAKKFDGATKIPSVHEEWWELCCSPDKYIAIAAPRGHAKAQPLDAKVMTPNGWSTIGDLSVGDYVIGGDGLPSKVTELHPIQEMDLFRITMRGGASALCNLGHLWNVTIPSNTGDRVVTKTTEELLSVYKGARDGERRVFIDSINPIQYEEKELSIDPYTLGAWLGDGHSAGSRFTTADTEMFDYIKYPVEKQSAKYGYVIRGIGRQLRDMSLINNKHIPEHYLRASIEQRIDLLNGLFDTDGSVSTDGMQAVFVNKNERLIANVTELIRGLGGYANVIDNWTTCNGKEFFSKRIIAKFDNGINPFRLSRKRNKWKGSRSTKAAITSIQYEKTALGRCITVERDTYITDDYLLTHNSTSITFSYIMASVLFRQHSFVLLVSNTETQSSLFLGDIKNELLENEDIVSLFGVKKFLKLSETDIIVEMTDGHKFRIIAKGAEQKLRGLKWNYKRPDLIVCDDLEDDEAVMNQARREKFREWFNGALIPAKSQEGKIVVVGTILHMDSLLERLMPKEHESTTFVTPLKVVSTKKSMWKSVKYRAHNEDFSQILWPERFTAEYFKGLRQHAIDQGMPDSYSREYLNYPIDENTAYFRREDFIPLKPSDIEDLEQKRVKYYTAADFAVSTVQRSDYTVITTVAVNSDGELLVVDVRRGRWDSSEVVDEMFSVQKRYKPELFTVEKGAINSAIGPFLNKEMVTRGVFLNLNPMTPSKDKMSRARGIQARMRAGGIRFDTERFWYPALEDEMARFPKDRHDDQVDSLSWIGLTLDKISEAPTVQEVEDEEYDEMIAENNMYAGRNVTTGY